MCGLRTVGRRSGKERVAILGYFEDGPNLVTLAMNGWGEGEPAWWLNLQARPDATVDLPGGQRAVRAREAVGPERERLWARWREFGDDDIDAYATLRSTEAAVVVLEPLPVVQPDEDAVTRMRGGSDSCGHGLRCLGDGEPVVSRARPGRQTGSCFIHRSLRAAASRLARTGRATRRGGVTARTVRGPNAKMRMPRSRARVTTVMASGPSAAR
jgi:deazaflavin-dependent oxidoreductase (nitroreductase family)